MYKYFNMQLYNPEESIWYYYYIRDISSRAYLAFNTPSKVPTQTSLQVKKLELILNIFLKFVWREECSNSEVRIFPLG
jgi:hypothetical protein